MKRLEQITGQKIVCYRGDVRDKKLLTTIFREHAVNAVIHFAGLKSVSESVAEPLAYYDNNLGSAISLLEVMKDSNVKKLIFSSSATVYGSPSGLPLKETSRTGVGITNPYGWSKFMIEQILTSLAASDASWQITSLRYFNPIGAHESGLIGESPNGTPNNLMPFIAQVAAGKQSTLKIFGDDYDTPDGTGVRDYIHVVDLAKGHLAALKNLSAGQMQIYNLGTGRGVSVLELVEAFEKASGQTVPYEITGRRPGDVATCYADASKAAKELGWRTVKTLEEACADTWRWQTNRQN